MCHGEDQFWSWLFDVLWTPFICISESLPKLGKFSATVLNMFYYFIHSLRNFQGLYIGVFDDITNFNSIFILSHLLFIILLVWDISKTCLLDQSILLTILFLRLSTVVFIFLWHSSFLIFFVCFFHNPFLIAEFHIHVM